MAAGLVLERLVLEGLVLERLVLERLVSAAGISAGAVVCAGGCGTTGLAVARGGWGSAFAGPGVGAVLGCCAVLGCSGCDAGLAGADSCVAGCFWLGVTLGALISAFGPLSPGARCGSGSHALASTGFCGREATDAAQSSERDASGSANSIGRGDTCSPAPRWLRCMSASAAMSEA
jgi:hypothetical protein